MRLRDIAAVACAITGFIALATAVPVIQGLATLPFWLEEVQGNIVLYVIAWLVPSVLLVLGGVCLLVWRHKVAAWIVSDNDTSASVNEVEELQDLAFGILGLYFVISTLPDLAALAGSLINMRAQENAEQFSAAFRSNMPFYIGTLLKFVIGAYLFFHAHSLAALWRKRKNASRPQPVPVNASGPACPNCGTEFVPTDYRPDAAERLCSKCHVPLPSEFFRESV